MPHAINPGHITLADNGISNKQIGVINTGQTEQTQLTFQVTDSSGQALNADNRTEVKFSLGSSPGGNEDVYPKTVTTDENGQATTTLTSGTEAGMRASVGRNNHSGWCYNYHSAGTGSHSCGTARPRSLHIAE
ncbi:MAG: hypothetical protein U5J63_00410 [Fodinibius sp.]|nr:hypothetical protein [Fodinibius sp.]